MKTAVARDLAQIRAQIEDFLKSAREPALLEPGEELLPLNAENYALEIRGSRLTLQAWDRTEVERPELERLLRHRALLPPGVDHPGQILPPGHLAHLREQPEAVVGPQVHLADDE